MSAYNELCLNGTVGPDTIDLTRSVIRAIASIHNFPHPEEGMSWTDPHAYDLAASMFFAQGDGLRRLSTLATQATNERHLRSLLHTTIKRWFQTLGRRSEKGRLHRALTRVLREEDAFVDVAPGEFWTLQDEPKEPGPTDGRALGNALAATPVTIIRARPEATNRAPWASREDQVAALTAMLAVADTAVHIDQIADTVADRIGLADLPTAIDVDQADGDPHFAVPTNVDDVDDMEHAKAVFAQLGHRERLVLAHWEETVQQTAHSTGIPSSSVHDARRRVQEALRRALEPEDVGVIRALRALCERYEVEPAGPRTEMSSLASTTGSEEASDGD